MKKYITPELKHTEFNVESILTASAGTAEDKLRRRFRGNDYGIKAENIKTVTWAF